jgi:L-histidine N-alpha-methyltransferase
MTPPQSYTVLTPQPATDGHEALAEEVLVSLSAHPKHLPSRLFYDAEGSRLFARITQTEAYYPTRTERELLRAHGLAMIAPLREGALNLVDLGAGDGHKTAILLEYLLARGAKVRYVPIDISASAMQELVQVMGARFPALEIAGLVGEYFEGLRWLSRNSDRQNLVLFLGSNIGNFNQAQASGFLHRLWRSLHPGDLLLIGFDLKKDLDMLHRAYNDPEGLTREFNLNLLRRLNRELGANFEPACFRHYGAYNAVSGAMESYLVSQLAQEVSIEALGVTFHFAPWEAIHTEFSYKYLEADIAHLARTARFRPVEHFFDQRRWFCDALWQV